MGSRIKTYLSTYTEAAPLAGFRILFGSLMLISIIRFWWQGWIEQLYLEPGFQFKYLGFEFVQVPGIFTYGLFAVCGLSAFSVALGYQYRWSIITFFLSFTYIELMDKTTYLNHYYFISILSFLLIFLPAGHYFSVDAKRQPSRAVQYIPRWNIDAVKLLLGIVYFFAGIAKLNADWLLEALPLRIWLPANANLPIIGPWLTESWVHYAFSWAGAVYDLSIVFFLWFPKTRPVAFLAVLLFHIMTRILFPIGMFPYIMICATLIFFSAGFHHRLLEGISRIFRINKTQFDNGKYLPLKSEWNRRLQLSLISLFFIIQLLLPFRYLLYPGHLFWTEEGFRFSWRVMLMEKTGSAQFKVVAPKTGKRFYVDNREFLNAFQEKQMATQPDFILEYAHFLGRHFRNQGLDSIQVFVDSYVALNGRPSRPYIDPTVDLLTIKPSYAHKEWILPYEE